MKEVYRTRLAAFYRNHRRMPSYGEMLPLFGVASKNAVYYIISHMVREGYVTKDAQRKLAPRNLYGEAKVLGSVQAGFPSPAEEELCDTMSLDDYLIENKEASFILRVKGDSMIEAGICDGDMVVVERTSKAKIGQIVIAEVDGEWTIKYLREKRGVYYLEPANKEFADIYPEEALSVAAVVKAVIRKY